MSTLPSSGHSAWTRLLFEREFAWLRNHLQRRTQNRHDAEDFAAETFLRVLRLDNGERIREPRALLTTIARRVMYESWRRADLERAYRESLASLPQELQPSPQDQYLASEALQMLDRLLDGLPGKVKAAFIHYHFGGLTYRQIAQELGVSGPRIHQYMERAYRCCLQVLLAP
ncbi:RNA polymerase sigma factor [Pseudomonas sp. StFLB209]|uniref:sigma-70 family RNA polymerase sigma factor n=1 Tax=Pseudomonas sp. StFLB209 TaxID=1028989 RepID=UPI0004F6C1A9|nr:sigma-70 family RNA polymerase sigma factor [Pseudomonas sp. StFLB209]BAP44859.1 RNA polymerase sigma factor [Pseudomonas sp. StFLB209]